MNILITGANGYIGRRLIPHLLQGDHELYCCVRNRIRFEAEYRHTRIHTIEIDFQRQDALSLLPVDLDAAYYLMHSMSAAIGDFESQESTAASNFLRLLSRTSCRQIIYLGGIVNEERLSRHLSSRQNVERILRGGTIPLTALRAGIVVGSGSASFEIIRDLVEKLPVMIAPQWLATRTQPIAVRDVIQFLVRALLREDLFNTVHDIGGPEVLTYKEMLLQFAAVRGLRRWIVTVPVMSPRLSSYWLYFITSTSYRLAANLVDSMKVSIICRPSDIAERLGIVLTPYRQAVEVALEKIDQGLVVSSWKDSFVSSGAALSIMDRTAVPSFGCYKDVREHAVGNRENAIWQRVWAIGGESGWYYGDFLWELRGLMDKAVGGVGLNRGRTRADDIHPGDAVDFWRALVADSEQKRLVLYAEMKLPGEAWLEFVMAGAGEDRRLRQTATFRPRGLSGRLYWYMLLPVHHFIFKGMINGLARGAAASTSRDDA